MIVLGLHLGHNATVSLSRDGLIIGLLSQEKLNDIKNSAAFPSESIKALLNELNLSYNDIDEIAIAGEHIHPQYCYDYLCGIKSDSNQSKFISTLFSFSLLSEK